MARGWKILVGVVVAIAVLLALNTVVTDKQTKPAEVTVAGGKIVKLPGGDLQVLDAGPRVAKAPQGGPIVLIHCFTCAIDWWDAMRPRLERRHRVVAVDLLGHGGSEKPRSGYTVPNQADLVAQALGRLGVSQATVVGHSLGGAVAVALAEQSPQLVDRVVIVDTPPTHERGDLGLVAKLGFAPVVGELFWRVKPDFAVRKGLGVAFAPGYDVPDAFVEDLKRMTFNSYDDSPKGFDDFIDEAPLDERMRETGKPLLAIMGAEEQIVDDPAARLDEYRDTVPGARTELIAGAGHSPNVERPALTAKLVLAFAAAGRQGGRRTSGTPKEASKKGPSRHEMQKRLQNGEAVRKRP